jgi:hypothetical protein
MSFTRRRATWVSFSLCLLAGATVHCVGDDPEPASGGSTDASTTPDASSGDSAVADGATVDAGADASIDPCKGLTTCPSHVDGSHLQLWLRGDSADCSGGRVTKWHDLSGHGRDAVPEVYSDSGVALAPACGSDTINGRTVLTFDAPDSSAPFFAGTLTVDLSFMANANYSVYIVHRPQAPLGHTVGLLAADHTTAIQTTILCSDPTNSSMQNDGNLDFGMNGGADAATSFTYDRSAACSLFSTSSAVNHGSTKAWLEILTFDKSTGHQMTDFETVTLTGDAGVGDLTQLADNNLQSSAIGRRSNAAADLRYYGDIAEIVVYDLSTSSGTGSLDTYFEDVWGLP